MKQSCQEKPQLSVSAFYPTKSSATTSTSQFCILLQMEGTEGEWLWD